MLLLVILFIVAIAFGAVWFGLVPPPNANMLLRIRSGAVSVSRGRIQPHAREHVAEILTEAGVSRGFIAVTPGDRVIFSWRIPGRIHQRLRNVLLNQWG